MSGEKIAELETRRNAEREAQRRAALEAEIAQVQTECGEIARAWTDERGEERIGTAGHHLAALAQKPTTETTGNSPEERLSAVRARRAELATGRMRDEAQAKLGATLAEISTDPKDSASRNEAEQRATRAIERVGECIGEANETERDRLGELCAQTSGTCDEHARETAELELRWITQKLRKRTAQRELAHELRVRVAGLEGTTIDRLRATIERCEHDGESITPGIRSQVETAAREAETIADRRYAQRVLIEELKALGYRVESNAQTSVPINGRLELARSKLGEYGVELESVAGEEGVRARMVRRQPEPTDRLDERARRTLDGEREEQWCADLARAMEQARTRGVDARVRHGIGAGEHSVAVRKASAVQQQRKRSKARDRTRSAKPN